MFTLQVDKMAKQMSLESQLADAKLQKAYLEFEAERERIFAEMKQLKVAAAEYKAKILELKGTEIALKDQIAVYTEKYDDFQNALVKSNQVFGGFKEQVETVSLLFSLCLIGNPRPIIFLLPILIYHLASL